jgi:tetratricopeptide (TPR) repeat protein
VDDVESRADALVREGKLDEAFELLEQAYYAQPDPEPRLLFGLGIIELERGNCEAAVGYLGRFLATSPSEDAAAKAREVIAYCEAELRAKAEPPSEPSPEPDPEPTPSSSARAQPSPELEPSSTDSAPEVTDAPSEPSPWARDGLGWGLLGTGVAVTAVGAGLLVQARGDVRAAEASDDEASFDHSLQRVDALRAIGGSLTGVGVGLLIGAAVRFGVVARRNRRASISGWIDPKGRGPWLRTTIRF